MLQGDRGERGAPGTSRWRAWVEGSHWARRQARLVTRDDLCGSEAKPGAKGVKGFLASREWRARCAARVHVAPHPSADTAPPTSGRAYCLCTLHSTVEWPARSLTRPGGPDGWQGLVRSSCSPRVIQSRAVVFHLRTLGWRTAQTTFLPTNMGGPSGPTGLAGWTGGFRGGERARRCGRGSGAFREAR